MCPVCGLQSLAFLTFKVWPSPDLQTISVTWFSDVFLGETGIEYTLCGCMDVWMYGCMDVQCTMYVQSTKYEACTSHNLSNLYPIYWHRRIVNVTLLLIIGYWLLAIDYCILLFILSYFHAFIPSIIRSPFVDRWAFTLRTEDTHITSISNNVGTNVRWMH